MSYADRIRASRNPMEAMVVLGEALDALNSNLAELDARSVPADPWGDWTPGFVRDNGDGTTTTNVGLIQAQNAAYAATYAARNETAIKAVREALEAETDPENTLALQAKLRLLEDSGGAVDIDTVAGIMPTTVEHDENTATMVIAPPSVEKQAMRKLFAEAIKLETFIPLPAEDAYSAYAKGGPLWLYAGNREAVMAMPFGWRQQMVEDVLEDSPRAAQEMGRDVLKDEEATGNMGQIIEELARD